MIALCLTSCGGPTAGEVSEEIQAHWSTVDSLSLTAELTADYGDRLYPFTLRYEGSADSGTITILAPESVSGVTAHVSDGGATLSYDGAQVYTGALTQEGLSPMDAIPAILTAWHQSFVTEAVYETLDGTQCCTLLYRITDEVSLRTWFDAETYIPLEAEIISGGFTVIHCRFSDITA